MNRVTSRLRVTIPRHLAERYGIRPGDKVEWIPASDGLRLEPVSREKLLDVAERLRLFNESTERQQERERRAKAIKGRGWAREDLYNRAWHR